MFSRDTILLSVLVSLPSTDFTILCRHLQLSHTGTEGRITIITSITTHRCGAIIRDVFSKHTALIIGKIQATLKHLKQFLNSQRLKQHKITQAINWKNRKRRDVVLFARK